MFVAHMAPRSRGRLALRDIDPSSSPVIDTGYFTDADGDDLAELMDGVAIGREDRKATAPCRSGGGRAGRYGQHRVGGGGRSLRSPLLPPCRHLQDGSRLRCRRRRRFVRQGLWSGGTLRSGRVDHAGSYPRANTNLPTLMVAEKIVSRARLARAPRPGRASAGSRRESGAYEGRALRC